MLLYTVCLLTYCNAVPLHFLWALWAHRQIIFGELVTATGGYLSHLIEELNSSYDKKVDRRTQNRERCCASGVWNKIFNLERNDTLKKKKLRLGNPMA